MKWKLLASVIVTVVFSVFLMNQTALANVFASQIKITNPDDSPFDGDFSDGSVAKISYYLNDGASVVTVTIIDVATGNTVATIDGGASANGLNSVEWDGTGATANSQYVVQVYTEQANYSTTDWTMFFDSGPISIYTRGVAVNRNQSDSNFGMIFTSNDGGPIGTGIAIYNPDGSNADPYLVAADQANGGTVNYGTDAPLFAELDWQGRVWVTLKDLGQVMRINRDYSTQVVIDGLSFPTGFYLTGEGEDFTIYVSANNQILRGNIGTADTFDPASLEVVAEFSTTFPRQIMLDDDGAMYVTLRQSIDLGSDGNGIRKYDISGTLPVTDNDASWFLSAEKTFIANDLLLDSGDDPNSSADDILYYCTRAGSGFDQDGIWRVDDINGFFPDTIRIATENMFYGGDENVNARSTIDFDAAGNIVFMENSNEHSFFISPPGDGANNSFTTTAPDTFTVTGVITGIEHNNGVIPMATALQDNYPNPFNPSTVIPFDLRENTFVTLNVYDMLGRKVATLVNGQLGAGSYKVDFDAANLPSGYYIYDLKAGNFSASKKMLLTK
ncbi:MAG: T9SS type A sorting domain-containing protein [Calditrichaeota bacterium]|nr:T9SS type A sorting domain-containing protein [Calditrichota bacterium]MCB9068979.1 T9SS type A sorting domain-containing protein [Calditrichia bacterium]